MREVGLGLVTLGLVIVAFVAYQLWGTGFAEAHSQAVLHRQFLALHAESTGEHSSASGTSRSSHPGRAGAPGNQPARPGGRTGVVAHDPVVSSSGSGASTSAARGDTHSHAGTPAAGEGGLTPSPPVGQAVDHIVIPSIGVDKYVVQGVAENDLAEGPGHYPGTPLPGQQGNVGIAGHRTTYGAPFFELGRLRPGAWIYITDTEGRTFDYRVLGHHVVNPDDVGVLAPSHRALLTLTTCNPPYSAATRLVVLAALVGSPTGTPTRSSVGTRAASSSSQPRSAPGASPRAARPYGPSRPQGTSVSAAEPFAPTVRSLTEGNADARGPAIAFGALVVALWVATRVLASRRRGWHKAATLAAGVAIAAVPLWLCFEQVVRLLPPTV